MTICYLDSLPVICFARASLTKHTAVSTTDLHDMRLLLFLLCGIYSQSSAERTFAIDFENNCFLKDGRPYRYISGTIHYVRVPAQYWEDRLMKLRALGCNAVQTYIMWFWHEPVQGQYTFSGSVNITRFFTIAQRLGLDVILRPGPYSDAEQDMGGFPAWTLKERGIKYRTADPRYTQLVKTWWDKLLPIIKPFLHTNGGPIIMVQIENEYGWWEPCDKNYISWLFNLAKSHLGEGIVYFTTDIVNVDRLKCGHINGTYASVDFGSGFDAKGVNQNFQAQRAVSPKGPLVNSEFYPGWFTEWGEKYRYTPASDVIKTMNAMYAVNASFNIYLAHGGTNFGYSAGAEKIDPDPFRTIMTSYDWSAPIREDGHTIGKFFEMQQAIHALTGRPIQPLPPPIVRQAYGSVRMRYYGTLFDHLKDLTLGEPVHSRYPLTAEDIDHYYGFLLYEVKLPKETEMILNVTDAINDRGDFFLNRQTRLMSTQRGVEGKQELFQLTRADDDLKRQQPSVLSILVENQGRICFTPRLVDYKGIVRNITVNGRPLENWTVYRIDFTKLIHKIKTSPRQVLKRKQLQSELQSASTFLPSVFAGEFDTKDKLVGDTWIDTTDWGKGQMFSGSGFGLGRYWASKGPQLTLYHPHVISGRNRLIFFELEKAGNCFSSDKCYSQSVLNPLW